MRFNIDEAELHTFVNRIKEQSKTIQTLTADLSQQRTDASQAQQKHVKWQKELRDKVSGFREERRNWQAEATGLRADLQEVQAFASQQGEELAGVKNERFVLHSQMLEATPQLRHLEDYKARIKQLTDSQLLW
jgi:multidrug resistance efflux pump